MAPPKRTEPRNLWEDVYTDARLARERFRGFTRDGEKRVEMVAKQNPFENFVGWYEDVDQSPFHLITSAARKLNSFAVFESDIMRSAIQFKWEMFAHSKFEVSQPLNYAELCGVAPLILILRSLLVVLFVPAPIHALYRAAPSRHHILGQCESILESEGLRPLRLLLPGSFPRLMQGGDHVPALGMVLFPARLLLEHLLLAR